MEFLTRNGITRLVVLGWNTLNFETRIEFGNKQKILGESS